VILLDPMFPERQKSALVKKKFQLLQQLECPCTDEEELLQAAINAKPRKIIIKRPAKGPFLANRKPDYSISGKAIRYDCIVIPRG
jgi:16S rRNA (guanine1516-N2)-methyltransferase